MAAGKYFCIMFGLQIGQIILKLMSCFHINVKFKNVLPFNVLISCWYIYGKACQKTTEFMKVISYRVHHA